MYDNKQLFKELLKNTDENFKKREELIQLHKDNYALASNIKIRKEVEKEIIKKNEKLLERQNEMDKNQEEIIKYQKE